MTCIETQTVNSILGHHH